MYRGSLLKFGGDLFDKIIHQGLLVVVVSLLLAQSGCKLDTITVGSVDDDVFLKRKNQSLFLKVAGNIGSRKLLLIVHGGPGGNGLDYRDSIIKSNVESKIAVGYWDQRFGGNSQGNGGASDLDSYREDLRVVVQYLKAKYGDDLQIYLMGHSWGGFLTPFFLGHEQNQQFISGWIQVDGAHDYPLNDSLTEDMLSKRARIEIAAQRNLSHWQSVLDYCNNHNSSDGYEVSAQLNQYAHDGELLMDSVFVPETTYSADPSTSYSNNRFNGVVSGILGVDRPTYDIDPESYLKKINVPAFFIWGWFDFVCPPALCDDLQLKVGSSDKTIQYFYHSGHSPMMNEPELFWNSVLDWIDKH
ncbi:MAG: alpha/beta fold hydrolase [Bacteroidota bacterium]|jgi:pimeloyl-ACP methyl ester carboxylesterase